MRRRMPRRRATAAVRRVLASSGTPRAAVDLQSAKRLARLCLGAGRPIDTTALVPYPPDPVLRRRGDAFVADRAETCERLARDGVDLSIVAASAGEDVGEADEPGWAGVLVAGAGIAELDRVFVAVARRL